MKTTRGMLGFTRSGRWSAILRAEATRPAVRRKVRVLPSSTNAASQLEVDVALSIIYAGAFVVLLLIVGVSRRARRHGGAYRAGVVGAMYE